MEKIHGIEFGIMETERLILREITPKKTREIFSKFQDSEIMEVLGIETEEELKQEKNNLAKGIETYYMTFKKWVLILKENRKVIGFCSFHTWNPSHFRSEIGYRLKNDSHKGKRYMSEALEKILEHGFLEMKLNRVDAYISPDNYASQNLVKKFGFSQEGYHREDYLIGGVFHDSLVYSLLKKEYSYR
ncbi:MAG: GNAT family N-acetyltransferase [Fusobacteriaceae bacterium]